MNSIPHHSREEFSHWLGWRLDGLLRSLQPAAAPGLLSVTLALPGFALQGVPLLREGDFYWAHPEGGMRLLGRGLALVHHGSGSDRLEGLSARFGHDRSRWRHLDPDGSEQPPLMFTGFAFDPMDPMEGPWQGFPNSGLFLPELLLRQQGEASHVVLSCRDGLLDVGRQVNRWLELLNPLLEPQPHRSSGPHPLFSPAGEPLPTDRKWLALGREALEEIGLRQVQKLVLYRRLRIGESACISDRSLAAAMEDDDGDAD